MTPLTFEQEQKVINSLARIQGKKEGE